MSKQIFRQAALDRLSSPEQLDRPHTLVSATSWLVLLTLALVVISGAYWALISYAPVKVGARGIVLLQAGLYEIIADSSGRIHRLTIKSGDIVNAGMPIAEFKRNNTKREIKLAHAELDDAQDKLTSLKRFYASTTARQSKGDQQRLRGLKQSELLIARRRKLLAKRIRGIRRLVNRKVAVSTKLISAELEMATAIEKSAQLRNQITALRSDAIARINQQGLTLLDERLKIDRLKRQLSRLRQQLKEERILTSPYAGRVVEVKMNTGDVVSSGAAIATLEPLTTHDEQGIAVLYVDATEGKRIKPGMSVEIEPSGYEKAQYGFINGQVTSVSKVPTTLQGMRSVLRNERLANELSGGASPFEVRVQFTKDSSTPSGLSWSSSKGPPGKINPGTLLKAAIVVDRLPIADLVIPGLSAQLGLNSND